MREEGGNEKHYGGRGGDRTNGDARVQVAPPQQAIAERSAAQYAHDRARADYQ